MLRLDGIIFTIINLVILYVAMRHFLIGPIQSVLAKRKELIDSQFAKAEEKEAEALELKDKYDDMLSHTKESLPVFWKPPGKMQKKNTTTGSRRQNHRQVRS